MARPRWSQSSNSKLLTCDPDIQIVASAVLYHWDCKVLYGHRTPAEQKRLFDAGRSKCDGYDRLSYHNYMPSLAIDLVPCPVLWPDAQGLTDEEIAGRIERFHVFGGFVLGMARSLGIPLYWGNDWDGDWDFLDQTFNDLPHFELRRDNPLPFEPGG